VEAGAGETVAPSGAATSTAGRGNTRDGWATTRGGREVSNATGAFGSLMTISGEDGGATSVGTAPSDASSRIAGTLSDAAEPASNNAPIATCPQVGLMVSPSLADTL
jgi:hypothetical protein